MNAEPRFGIFAVRVAHKSRIRVEGTRGPLPDIAEHLAAAHETVAVCKGADRSAAVAAQVGGRLIACALAPWVAPPRAVARKRCRDLPFGFARQAPAGGPAIRVRPVAADAQYRKHGFELHPLVEA